MVVASPVIVCRKKRGGSGPVRAPSKPGGKKEMLQWIKDFSMKDR